MFGQSLLSAFGSAACTTDTDQLFTTDVQTTSVATYQFNNATTSIPNNTYPAAASNQTYTTGKFGNAIEANGSNTRVDISNLNVSTFSAITISAWVYWQSTDAPRVFSGKSGGVTNRQTFDVQCNANKVRYIDNQRDLYDAPITLATGWHHFAVTDDYNGNHIIYVDGQAITSNFIVSSSYSANSSATMFYGMRNTGSVSGSETKGIVDQLRIFNTVLPQSAITVLYNETTTTATYPYIDYVGANPNSIAYYKMSDATDQLGNYNGTATNVNFNTVGKFGFAGAFNGSSSRIEIPNASKPSLSTATVSFWLKTSSTNTQGLVGEGYSGNHWGNLQIYLSSNKLNARSGNASSTEDSPWLSTSDVNTGNWVHCVVTITGNTSQIFINGTLETTKTLTVTRAATTNPFTIGQIYANGTLFSGWTNDCSIDQVRIYDSVLSAANVTTLYNEIECPAVAVTNAFNTVLYTGNGGTQSVTGVGFQPDLTWIKDRDTSARSHILVDSVRGATKQLSSDNTSAELVRTSVTGFNSGGFSVGNYPNVNENGNSYVAWNWKAGGTAVSNTDGDNNSAMVSANPDAGFSIITYTGDNTNNSSVGHGLNQAPEMFIYKRTSSSGSWGIVHKDVNNYKAYLSFTTGGSTNDTNMNAPTDSVIRFNTTSPTYNGSGQDWLIYAFHSVDGYQRVGSYVGTGQPNNDVFTGFRPRWVMIKNTAGQGWNIVDSFRNPSNPANLNIQANDSAAESSTANPGVQVDFDDTGFSLVAPAGTPGQGQVNSNGATYIYLAIA